MRIREALSSLQTALLETEERCAAFRQQFIKYSHLWQVEMPQALHNFLESGASAIGSVAAQDALPMASTSETGAAGQPQPQQEQEEQEQWQRRPRGPSLEAFAAEIGKYRAIQDEVQALPSCAALGWIKVDAKPVKQALLTWTSKWIYLYMRHLRDEVGWGCSPRAEPRSQVGSQGGVHGATAEVSREPTCSTRCYISALAQISVRPCR